MNSLKEIALRAEREEREKKHQALISVAKREFEAMYIPSSGYP